jgi:glycosyltransferase involved in cell wall biosynthesis
MNFHLLALPNAQTTKAYDLCGFTQMTIKFARLLKELGHHVTLYASEENDAPCDELVTVITKEETETLLATTENAQGMPDPTPYQYAHIEAWSPIWQLANSRMILEIGKRKQPRDILATIGGASQAPVAKRHPDLLCIEYSIGYISSFADHRVFESEAWRHLTYGAQGFIDGRFFDTVIPCFYDPAEFPFRAKKEPFAVYCGRLVRRKGVEIACRAAQAAGVPLYVIGHGKEVEATHGADYLGALPAAERNAWLSRATAVFTPTTYIEPFNQVAIEAQLCGTPVISTDFGGFTETVEQGKTGFRCSYLGEFVQALQAAPSLDPAYIRRRAIAKYSLEAVAPQYQAYFERVQLKWGAGWDTLEAPSRVPAHAGV